MGRRVHIEPREVTLGAFAARAAGLQTRNPDLVFVRDDSTDWPALWLRDGAHEYLVITTGPSGLVVMINDLGQLEHTESRPVTPAPAIETEEETTDGGL